LIAIMPESGTFAELLGGVMNEARKLCEEMWAACQDDRTCEEIIEGIGEPMNKEPACGWAEFMEKLHLLRHYIDYAKRLCDGSLNNPSKDESEA